MPRVAVITDTDASLPLELAQRYQIRLVPIRVNFGQESLRAVFDIDDAATFERIRREGRIPTTAAPAPGDFLQAFEEAFAAGADEVLCFTVSSALSATYNAALRARDMLPDKPITVVDTYNLSLGQGFMVLAAAEALAQGASVPEAVAYAQDVGRRTRLFAVLPTLKYLAMSGRVGHLAAGMAGLLRIMPILTVREGQLQLLEKVRTRKRAWSRALALVQQALDGAQPERLAIIHIHAAADARAFHAALCQHVPCPDQVLFAELTPGLSVHAGEGLVGVVFVLPA